MNITERVAGQVRAEMARRGVLQRDVAQALGVTQPAVSKRLKGQTPFNVAELETVADLLGVRIVDLIPE